MDSPIGVGKVTHAETSEEEEEEEEDSYLYLKSCGASPMRVHFYLLVSKIFLRVLGDGRARGKDRFPRSRATI